MNISGATLKKVGEVAVDGGSFIVFDPCYLTSELTAHHFTTREDIEKYVKEWHGYIAHWGDGDYPIFEVIADDGFCHGLLIMM